MTDYIKVDWAEVRAGDVLMHENGDRLTVSGVSSAVGEVHVLGIWRREESLRKHGYTPHRKVAPVPTEPGAYLDKDGVLCVRQSEETESGPIVWFIPEDGAGSWRSSRDMSLRAPFTRLVPMPTEENVHSVIYNAMRGSAVEGLYVGRAIAAFMALLRGGGDDE